MATSKSSVRETTFDPETLEEQARIAFPRLSETQIEKIARIAKPKEFADGETLWAVGDREAAFHVISEGVVAIRQPIAGGGSHLIVSHGPGGFTGDIDLLSSKASAVEGVASGATKTLAVCPETLKKLVVADPEISDILLAAFLARRRLLIARSRGELTLIGSRYSPKLYALREFLERNSRPFTWIDLESDPEAEQLLDSFQIGPEETPAVITSETVCRSPNVE